MSFDMCLLPKCLETAKRSFDHQVRLDKLDEKFETCVDDYTKLEAKLHEINEYVSEIIDNLRLGPSMKATFDKIKELSS